MIALDDHDAELVDCVEQAIERAYTNAHSAPALAKRVATIATRFRNKGRGAAKRRHPFKGICEASGQPLDAVDAVLDELDPDLGYAGPVRWVCPKANNSGPRSCGKC